MHSKEVPKKFLIAPFPELPHKLDDKGGGGVTSPKSLLSRAGHLGDRVGGSWRSRGLRDVNFTIGGLLREIVNVDDMAGTDGTELTRAHVACSTLPHSDFPLPHGFARKQEVSSPGGGGVAVG